MTEKKPKRPRDPNQLAKLIVGIATGETEQPERTVTEKRASKAGSVGGPARARALSAEQRSEIAKTAAVTAKAMNGDLYSSTSRRLTVKMQSILNLSKDTKEAVRKWLQQALGREQDAGVGNADSSDSGVSGG